MKTILLTALAIAPLAHGVTFIDDFANADNISSFGFASESVSSNILTVTRTDSVGDAGVDWLIGGTTRFSLDAGDAQSVLEITPSSQIGNGQWSPFVLLFDGSGVFLTELQVSGFTDSTSVSTTNIAEFATNEGFATAAEYLVRVRFQGETSSGFEFSQFAAVPEPSHYALMGGAALGAIVLLRRRRK